VRFNEIPHQSSVKQQEQFLNNNSDMTQVQWTVLPKFEDLL